MLLSFIICNICVVYSLIVKLNFRLYLFLLLVFMWEKKIRIGIYVYKEWKKKLVNYNF